MIPTERLLYKIDLKLNKVASGQGQNISKANKVLAIREAIKRLLKKKVGLNNLMKMGFDSFRGRYVELENLIVQYEDLTPEKTDEVLTSYQVELPSKFFMPVDILCYGKRGKCQDRLINVPRLVSHGEVQALSNNVHFNPSFIYQETFAVISDNKLILYSNDPEGDFEITKVKVSYLKYPQEPDAQGYKHFTGEPSTNVDCDISEILEDELLELAIMELAINTGNVNAYQGSLQKSQNSEL